MAKQGYPIHEMKMYKNRMKQLVDRRFAKEVKDTPTESKVVAPKNVKETSPKIKPQEITNKEALVNALAEDGIHVEKSDKTQIKQNKNRIKENKEEGESSFRSIPTEEAENTEIVEDNNESNNDIKNEGSSKKETDKRSLGEAHRTGAYRLSKDGHHIAFVKSNSGKWAIVDNKGRTETVSTQKVVAEANKLRKDGYEVSLIDEEIKNKEEQAKKREQDHAHAKKHLSKEAYKAYDHIYKQFEKSDNIEVADKAHENAMLLTAFVENNAKIMNEAGHKTTPLEMAKQIALDVNAKSKEELGENSYGMPLNPTVDLNKEIPVVAIRPRSGITDQELNNAIRNTKEIKTVVDEFIVEVGNANRNVRGHLRNGHNLQQQYRLDPDRRSIVRRINSALKHSVLVESIDNKNPSGKPHVVAVHRLYSAVKLNDKIYPVRIVVEEFKHRNGENHNFAYDVIIERGAPLSVTVLKTVLVREAGTFNKISVANLLKDVKDYNGDNYIHPDGTGNFMTKNDLKTKIPNSDLLKRAEYNQDYRGMITFSPNNKPLIELFEQANGSTFIHEMGHLMLENLRSLAEMENAPKQIVQDWNKLRALYGYSLEEGADNTEAHEKFAKHLESYVRNGKAPKPSLQSVFDSFSQILKKLYKTFKELGGKPSKEVQDIMGRMLGADIVSNTNESTVVEKSKAPKQQKLFQKVSEDIEQEIKDIKEKPPKKDEGIGTMFHAVVDGAKTLMKKGDKEKLNVEIKALNKRSGNISWYHVWKWVTS